MITITGFENLNRYRDDADEVWAVVRSLRYQLPYMFHAPVLSPAWPLFKTYLRLRDKGEWNAKSFNDIYRPAFMEQIENDPAAQKKLEELIEKHNAGKNIVLVCFCSDVNLCHRSLISSILSERGVANTLS